MKIQKTITLDLELFMKVKEEGLNLSLLINTFLKEYFGEGKKEFDTEIATLKSEIIKKQTDLVKANQLLEEKEKQRIKERGIPFKLPYQE